MLRRSTLALLCAPLVAFYPWKKPKPEVRKSADWAGAPMRVLLLPATCASPDDVCDEPFTDGLDGKVASELEFGGYSVVAAASLVAEARSRDEAESELTVLGVKVAQASSKRQVGALFADLSPALQRQLMKEAGAQGVVSARIQVGAKNGLSPTRESTITLRLGLDDGTTMGWLARCTVKSSLNPPLSQSLAYGGDCAIQGALTGTFKD